MRSFTHLRRSLFCCTAPIPLLLGAGGTSAQVLPTPVATSAAPDGDEILVTAFRREESLQNVGASVTALSAERLRTSRINDVSDLASYSPSLDIKENVPGALPVITIRGIGLDDFSTTGSPAAGVYIDEVPLSSPGLMSAELYDLARVETLKGPQGTLYGRNTTAGAINIISARPTKDLEGYARASFGNYDTLNVEGMLNVPLSETAQLRFSLKTIQQFRGFWHSDLLADGSPGNRDIGSRNIWLGRAQLALQPTDDLSINLKIEGERSRSELGVPKNFGTFKPGQPFVPCAPVLAGKLDNSQCADAFGYQNTHSNPFHGDWVGTFPYNIDEVNLTAKVDYTAGDYKITSVTSYIDFKRLYHIDVDGTPLQQFDFIEDEKVRQFTQELRVARDTRLADFLVGAFYSRDRVLGNNTNLLDQWPLLLFGGAGGGGKTLYNQTTRSMAAFANATWHVTDKLDLITGLRYTHEERHYAGGTIFTNESPQLGVVSGLIDDRIKDSNITYKIGLNYRLTDDVLVYGSIARGVKSGGFFSGFTTSTLQLLPYEPESVVAYEVGAKTRLAPGLTINAAGFYYDYGNPQTFIRYLDPVTGISIQKVGNVDSAKVYGADIDASVRPFVGLTLSTGIGLLHSSLSSFASGSGIIPSGNRLPNAPTLSLNGLVRYEWNIGKLRASVQGETHHSSAVFKEAGNDPLVASGAFWLFNARVGLAGDGDRWEASIFGKNLGNKQYVVQGVNLATLGFVNRNYNAPRTYGAELFFRF